MMRRRVEWARSRRRCPGWRLTSLIAPLKITHSSLVVTTSELIQVGTVGRGREGRTPTAAVLLGMFGLGWFLIIGLTLNAIVRPELLHQREQCYRMRALELPQLRLRWLLPRS